jgi:hypothetical protein
VKKPIKILKKLTDSVRFGFISLKQNRIQMEKTEPKPSQIEKTEKTEQNQKNRVNLVFFLKNRTETGRFELISISFKKKFNLIIFLIKTKLNQKLSTLI